MFAAKVGALAWLFLVGIAAGQPDTGAWRISESIDDFTEQRETAVYGFGGGLMLWVQCTPQQEVRLAILGDDDLFENGRVDLRFDGGAVEQFEFIDLDRQLVSRERDDAALVARLLRGREVRVRVRRWENEYVTGVFNLSGLTARYADAGCR